MSNDPNDPTSALSAQARLACWLTGGGTRRSPSTATSFFNMARERVAAEKTAKEWKRRKAAAQKVLAEEWDNSSRPHGMAAVSWRKTNGPKSGVVERAEQQQNEGPRKDPGGEQPAATVLEGQDMGQRMSGGQEVDSDNQHNPGQQQEESGGRKHNHQEISGKQGGVGGQHDSDTQQNYGEHQETCREREDGQQDSGNEDDTGEQHESEDRKDAIHGGDGEQKSDVKADAVEDRQ